MQENREKKREHKMKLSVCRTDIVYILSERERKNKQKKKQKTTEKKMCTNRAIDSLPNVQTLTHIYISDANASKQCPTTCVVASHTQPMKRQRNNRNCALTQKYHLMHKMLHTHTHGQWAFDKRPAWSLFQIVTFGFICKFPIVPQQTYFTHLMQSMPFARSLTHSLG